MSWNEMKRWRGECQKGGRQPNLLSLGFGWGYLELQLFWHSDLKKVSLLNYFDILIFELINS